MQLTIERETHNFIPIREFRAQHRLTTDFGIQLFVKGDQAVRGRVQRAQSELQLARQDVLDALPDALPLQGWVDYLPHLTRLFINHLHQVNTHIEMSREQMEQAALAFNQVCQALLYARIQAQDGDVPTVQQVYQQWLDKSVKLAPETHSYIHEGDVWAVQVVSHTLGPAGLVVWTEKGTYYVADSLFTCPVESFVLDLLHEIARQMPTR